MPTAETAAGTPSEDSSEVCDRATLDELWAEGDSLLPDLVEIFQSDLTKGLDELERALTTRDLATAGRIAHTLKGSAGTFGARHMRELAVRLELEVRAGQADQATGQFDEFRLECERVRRCLAAELERKLPPGLANP